MSTIFSQYYSPPPPLRSSNYALLPSRYMSMIRLPFPHLRYQLPRRRLSVCAAAVQQPQTQTWFRSALTRIRPASADSSLFHVAIDVSASTLPDNFTAAGQYVQIRIPTSAKPSFLAIASPPEAARSMGVFEFLLKRIEGSTADLICEMREGEAVEVSVVMGNGFEIGKVKDDECVLMFATGSGISTIRSLIESGFDAKRKSDVRLYYGARNLQRMAYQDRFERWEETGVKIIPVLSQPDDRWKGEEGYVQAAFSRAKQLVDASSTGAVLCGHKQMTEEITSILEAGGVSLEKILKNF